MTYIKSFIRSFVILFCSVLVTAHNTQASSPVDMLNNIGQEVIASLEKNRAELKANPTIIYKIVDSILLPHVDVTGMSRSVLGRSVWQKASTDEKNRFAHEFTRLVVRTYSGALTDYSGEKLKFFPIAAGYENQPFTQVKSAILRPNGRQISMSYKLVRVGNNWKIYDMSVEGVSLLQSFRSQFAAQLNRGNLNTLLETMAKHNAEKSATAKTTQKSNG